MTNSISTPLPQRRRFEGRVVSIAGASSAVVRIDRRIPHEKYGKYYTTSRKFMIDDPTGAAKIGDIVLFEECRPLSRQKRWRYVRTVTAATSSS